MSFFSFAPVIPTYVTDEAVQQFLVTALNEDLGRGPAAGDHSTLSVIPEDLQECAQAIAKASGVVAGMEMASKILAQLAPEAKLQVLKADGSEMAPGDVLLKIEGKARDILSCERLVLNCMQRMSGIATLARQAVQQVEGLNVQILDTRKTTPGFRLAEKWAVAIGGGTNHRFGLFDMIMLKDNHVDYAGGVAKAINMARAYLQNSGLQLKIEIETRSLQEVEEVLQTGGVDVIMLDNMTVPTMKQAVDMVAGRYKTEASGGIALGKLREVASTGVDYISLGALTHSATSLDISLKACR